MKRSESIANLTLKLNPKAGKLTLHTAGISKVGVEQMGNEAF